MANQPTPSLFSVSTLNTYNIQPIDGYEDVKVLNHFKTQGMLMLRDAALKDDPTTQDLFPAAKDKWRLLLRTWVKTPSRAHDLLDRPDYKEPIRFFDALLQRKTTASDRFDVRLRAFLIALTQGQSMDKHAKIIIEFAEDFFDKFLHEKIMISATAEFDVIFNGVVTNTNYKGTMVQAFDTARAAYLQKQVLIMRKEFVDLLHRHFMMAMVGADIELFDRLETAQHPLNCTPSDLTDWIQEKILDPKRSNIFLTLQGNNPIMEKSGFGKVSGGPGSGFPASNITSPPPTQRQPQPQQQQQQTQHGRGGAQPKASPSRKTGAQPLPGGGGGKSVKGSASSSPQSGVVRNCDFCKALNLKNQAGQRSISYTLHDNDWCVRNPASPRFDAVKASQPPKK